MDARCRRGASVWGSRRRVLAVGERFWGPRTGRVSPVRTRGAGGLLLGSAQARRQAHVGRVTVTRRL